MKKAMKAKVIDTNQPLEALTIKQLVELRKRASDMGLKALVARIDEMRAKVSVAAKKLGDRERLHIEVLGDLASLTHASRWVLADDVLLLEIADTELQPRMGGGWEWVKSGAQAQRDRAFARSDLDAYKAMIKFSHALEEAARKKITVRCILFQRESDSSGKNFRLLAERGRVESVNTKTGAYSVYFSRELS